MTDNQLPPWLAVLTAKDLDFIRHFIISSGSLKEMASYYNVSYPTVRLRLNKLIQKVSGDGMVEDDNYILDVCSNKYSLNSSNKASPSKPKYLA